VYLYGSSEDYNRWSELVGDDSWKWESVKKSFQAIENYDFSGSEDYKHLADPSANPHGTKGQLKVGLPPVLEQGVVPQMEGLAAAGEKINLDLNSGDPMGIAVFPHSYSKEGRSTSAIAHLVDPPSNLEVWTDAKAEKFVWDGKKVVGVVTEDGREAMASNEVIICGGSIDTPKLLLLNGIGPRSELEALSIDVKVDLPGVGKQLKDHVLTFMTVEVSGSINSKYAFDNNPGLIASAQESWTKDQTGAFALQHSSLWGGFLKLPDLESYEEYSALPPDVQDFLSKDQVPAYEFINNSILWPPGTQLDEGNTYMTFLAFLMNPQSSGSVTLRSANASDKPIITLNFLTHPYDVRVFREAIRNTWQKITGNSVVAPHIVRTILGPKSMEDAELDRFARENASTVWHACGTCKMGREEDAEAVVDREFKVRGAEGLRVVDMSVAPVTTNNHTQATAYLIAQKAAERLVAEYGLDRVG
jgi:choline dehydrogenase-like flavoprotein